RIGMPAEKIGGGQRNCKSGVVKSHWQTRRARGADDQVILVDRAHRSTGSVAAGRQHETRLGKSLTEIISLDAPCGIDYGDRYELRKSLCQVGATGGNIKCCHQAPLMIVDRGDRTGKPDNAGMKMLVAVNCQRTLLNNAGTDTVRALTLFAPDGTCPEPPAIESIVIARCAATFDRHALAIRQKHTTTDPADGQIKAVHTGLRYADKALDTLMSGSELAIGKRAHRPQFGRIKPVQFRRAPPRGDQSRDRKSTRLNSSHVKTSYAVFCLKK